MAHLTLAGLSDDGKRLLLVSDKGVEFTLDIDARLRAALRGEGQRRLEIQMDSSLRPRDIQARIRAGETPEAVAQAAHTTVDKIMPFAAPVIAERQHVAERAQRSSVRRRPDSAGSSGGARTLGEAVSGHLRALNVDPQSVEWDASRREDGRWTLTGTYSAGERSGSATYIYDGPGNYVTAEDDDARWLAGEGVPGAPRPTRDDLQQARERRLTALPGHDELPLGDDAIELVTEPDETASLGAEQPVEAYLDEPFETSPAPQDQPSTREAPAAGDEAPEAEPEVDDEPAPRRPAKKKGRASVPSWDEIMFGGGKSE